MELAAHLAACDLLVQPFVEGVTTRRTSLMAGLALGVPIVTNSGPLTESLWGDEQLVALVPVNTPQALAERVDGILQDVSARQALGQRGKEGYARLFSMERTIEKLRIAE